MADGAVILACCDALSATVDALDGVAKRTDSERKHDLVLLRRQLSEQIAALHNTVVASGGPLASGPLADEFRTRFSAMRNIVAIHQASFPAVLLDETRDDYRTSGTRTTALIRETIAWLRDTVKGKR